MGNISSNVSKILNLNKDWEEKTPTQFQKKVEELYTPQSTGYNPYIKRNGELVNKYINYQKVLDDPNVTSKAKQWITEATGLTPSLASYQNYANMEPSEVTESYSSSDYGAGDDLSAYNSSDLVNMDVTKMPKLSTDQIAKVITTHFPNSTVITAKDAKGIYDAQTKTGMSALAILGIGALESGWGTSNIAIKTNNIWGYGATNDNPEGNAHRYNQMSEGASQFATEYMNTYYNNYGAKSIYAAGTGNNPKGMGYAYFDNGSINPGWATSVGNIMTSLYNTAATVPSQTKKTTNYTSKGTGAYKNLVGSRVANTQTYSNNAAVGQCVWYVRGRSKEKLGFDPGSLGNGNEMWYNAKESSRVSPKAENIKKNMIASYGKGTGYDGALYGHAIFIEDVVGDTVYYTEGGYGYYQSGTDGVIKTATRQQILNGTDKNGNHFGSEIVGFIDLEKY